MSKKTWREFKEYLDESMKNFGGNGDEKSLIESYIKYIADFLRILEIKQMNFSNLNSITSFFVMVDKVVETTNYSYYLKPSKDKQLQYCDYNWVGKWYADDKYYYYICLEFNEDSIMSIWVRDRFSNKREYESLASNLISIEQNYSYDAHEYGARFSLSLDLYKRFNNEEKVEEQEKIFRQFFSEVIEAVQNKKIK